MRFDINVTGAKEIEKELEVLGKKTSKKIGRKSCRGGAKSVKPSVQSNARTMVGGNMGNLIAKSYRIRKAKEIAKHSGVYAIAIEPKPEVPQFVSISKIGTRNYIPAAIEYGHDNVPPIPFARKTAAQSERSAMKVMKNVFVDGIEAEWKKSK